MDLPFVKALVRCATGKRLTDRLPKLRHITTAGYSGSDRIYGSTCHQPAVPISGGPGWVFFQILDMRKFTFLLKAFSWWSLDSNSRPAAQVLQTTPFVKALVRWATGKRPTDRPPKLSLRATGKFLGTWRFHIHICSGNINNNIDRTAHDLDNPLYVQLFKNNFSPAPTYMFLLVYITDRIFELSKVPPKRLFFRAGVSEKKKGEYSLHLYFQIIINNDISMFWKVELSLSEPKGNSS